MGGACLKPVFCIRTQSGLTVQLHQILPISMRLQGLYKLCSPYRDNAFPSFPLEVSGPTHAFLSKTRTHTFLHALCRIELHLELVQREADVGEITEQPVLPNNLGQHNQMDPILQ